MALSLNDLKKGKAGKSSSSPDSGNARRMVRPWEDPTPQIELPPSLPVGAEVLSGESNGLSPTEKQVTNGEQTGNKEVTEQVTKREQTGDKQVTENRNHPPQDSTDKTKQVTERVTSNRVNRLQTGNKQVTKSGFEQLRGHEARLLELIFNECQTTGDLLSPPLTLERIAEYLESRKEIVKTVVVRLTKKGIVKRECSATGRGGFTRFRIEKELYQALLIRETGNKRVTNGEQIGNKQVAQRVTERVTNASSSSSSLRSLNKKEELLTTDEVLAVDQGALADAWQRVDCSPLTEIRFGRNQVAQIAREGKFTPDELQDSIYAFAFDLSENGKAKTITGVPLNYFMGILRRGPYAAPSNYESPDVRQKRLYLESKEQQRKKRLELDERLEKVEFEEWLEKLSLEQRAAVVPPKDFAKPGGTAHNYQMRQYFRENIWPDFREKVLRGESTTTF